MFIGEKTQNELYKWHKKAMPHVTLATQLLKLEEELDELAKAETDNDIAMELTDVIICSFILAKRFKSHVGFTVFNAMQRLMDGTMTGKVQVYLSLKLDINKSRKWVEIEPGVYRHEDKND